MTHHHLQPIGPVDFARVCFLVLMENGAGIMDKHPSYIEEKWPLLNSGYDAFNKLDIHNMRKVKAWCIEWEIEMPEGPAEYLRQSEEALGELIDRGFDPKII